MGRKNDNGAIMRWRRNMWVKRCIICRYALEAQHVGKTISISAYFQLKNRWFLPKAENVSISLIIYSNFRFKYT